MRNLYLLRHGEADHPGGGWSHDSKRPLTADGRQKMQNEARGLLAIGLPIDAIVTSPYVRARETAEAVAVLYKIIDRVTESEYLEPGASLPGLRKSLRGVPGDSILVVGHAPDLGVIGGQITGTEELPLGKGSLIWVGLDHPEAKENGGRLVALLPADLLARVGRITA